MSQPYTDAQVQALARPCRLGTETLHPKLQHVVKPQVSLILSINTGYE